MVRLPALKSSKGLGYFVLQVLRVCTVITLLAAAAGCWVLIIQVDKYKTFFVFQCLSLFFTSMGCLFLILAEFPVIKFIRNFYHDSWPVLSNSHGVGWMGFVIIVIGCHILGSLNEQGYDTDAFVGAFSQLVLSSGILCIIFGTFNIICSLVFRDAKQGITSRDIRTQGSLATGGAALPSYSESSVRSEKTKNRFTGFFKRGPNNNEADPYQTEQGHGQGHGQGHAQTQATSPIVPGLVRPESAMHPMNGHRVSSQYSVAEIDRH